jgi:hypothetical protein
MPLWLVGPLWQHIMSSLFQRAMANIDAFVAAQCFLPNHCGKTEGPAA